MKEVWNVDHYTGTITANGDEFYEMFEANFEASYSIRHKLNENVITDLLIGISSTALSLLTKNPYATATSVANSIYSIISSLSGHELNLQEQEMDHGAKMLKDVATYLNDRPSYKQAEVLFGFFEYEYTDGSKERFVAGNDFVIQRLQIETGEWIY